MMSTTAPFTVSSKCVMRLATDPDIIIENSQLDDVTDESQNATQPDERHTSVSASKSVTVFSDGRTESGWIFRNDEDQLLFNHQTKPSCKSSGTSNGKPDQPSDFQDNPVSCKESQQGRLLCPLSLKGRLLSLHNLPHPSILRKKAGSGTKRNREPEMDHPVEKHIQQLKKKKVAYFSKETSGQGGLPIQTETVIPTTAAHDSEPSDDVAVPLTPTQPSTSTLTTAAELNIINDIALVPAITVPLTEEEDEHWFKRHWQSQQPKSHSPYEE